jgi:TRAP-type C4-dicarboxylate transport system substrate-binding protein
LTTRILTRRTAVKGLLATSALGLSPIVRAGGPIVVKIATLAPQGTTWFNGLHKMGLQWAEASGGQVKVKIYPGGVAGHEGTVVRKMRIGQLHAGALTNIGLLDIDSAPQVVNTPMLIETNEELDHVMKRMAPVFARRLADKGFVVLNWSEVGWVRFFTRTPMRLPSDAKKFKVWLWDGDPGAVFAFRRAGFNPVVTASVDMIPSLQSGLLDGFPATPLSALSLQWFALAPNMLDVKWSPLSGATIITKKVWDAIPAQFHERFLAIARETGDQLKYDIRKQDSKAITVMKKYGLNVTEVDAATYDIWRKVAHSIHPAIRKDIVPSDIFDQTAAAVQEYRAAHP